ncbi:MAG: hypothetical protein GQ535_17550 [Rhodobacteraceae bacterium]|nr:hypothetical protein [Paracoccaceae bacterium]
MRSDWSRSTGETNLSIFVFNDLNGNGRYDIGDRAMSGIVTGLSQNGTPISVSRTNINGFANYAASSSHASVPLSALGAYDFEVFVPPGWRVSTENKVQQRDIIPVEGSNAGLGMAEMLHPVGLERYKFIRGTYGLGSTGTLQLMQNGITIAEVDISPAQEFLWPVDPGVYEIVSGETRREVRVGAYPVDIGTFATTQRFGMQNRVIGFENMAPSGLQKTPNGYGGLNWFNLNIVASAKLPDDIGYANGATSGYNVLYTSSGHPGWIEADTSFDFIDINLTVAWPQAEGEEAFFSFYRGNELVLQDHIGLSAYGPITYQPLISGITRVEISSQHNWQVVIDDLRVSTAN